MTSKDQRADGRNGRLEQLAAALKEAQTMLLEQSRKLDELRAATSPPGDALDDLRAQLELVTAERDQLQKQLVALEGAQIETVTLPHDSAAEQASDSQPSIDELVAGLDAILEAGRTRPSGRQFDGPSVEASEADADEMIAPEIMAPEAFASGSDGTGSTTSAGTAALLVYTEGDGVVKIPLEAGTMTIGRSEMANIRIDSPYVSRIHARLVSRDGESEIVDAGSTNGFKVNAVSVTRHRLKHGDVIAIGQRKMTFVAADRPT